MLRGVKFASQADLCYNRGSNIVVPEDVGSIPRPVANLFGRSTTMNTIPSTSGIYKITCTANKRIYIGSALNLRKRKGEHFNGLRNNRHSNPHMQRAWNKYGEQTFIFEVLEYNILPMSLTAREQYWFKKLKPFGRKGFNIAHEAGSQMGLKHTPETKEKLRQANIGKKLSPEVVEKMSQSRRGKKLSSQHIEKLRQAQSNPEMREKKRQSLLGLKRSPEEIEKSRQARTGIKRSPESIEKNRQGHLGQKQSPEAIEKIRQANLGRKHTPEACEKIGNAHRGKTVSPETREKLRQVSVNMSAETKEKLRQINLDRQRDEEGKFI